jgi:myo-inositol-1-phosphate synthase
MTAASEGRTGVAVIGLGGAVATTAVAGVEQMRLGSSTTAGLPFPTATTSSPTSRWCSVAGT